MRATRRYWAIVALAGTLAGLAVLVARPLLLASAVGLAAFLVAAQYAFSRALVRTHETLAVDLTLDRDRAIVDDPVTVTLAASFDEPAPLHLVVDPDRPVAARGPTSDDHSVTIDRNQRTASTTFQVAVAVAGVVELAPPTVTARDPLGLLTETLRVGPERTLTVEPRGPRDVHVGEGGAHVAAAFGDHPAGRLGPGLAPMELREYVPGDPANRIDWKATARMRQPYIREDEAETDRMTALVVDHRSAMAVGPDGETKLDYARQVALAIASSASDHDDPLGLYAVGDAGLTVARPPESAPGAYATVRRELYDLAPTRSADASRDRTRGPADARDSARRLDDESPFARTLRPFLDDAAAYVQRIEADPLFNTARTNLGRLRGTLWTVLFTDDSDRAQVREAVDVARRGNGAVAVFLTPDALFDPGGLADLETAYDRYRSFDAFRRDLARMDRVAAFEVAPGDRIEAVLDAHRRRRIAGGRG